MGTTDQFLDLPLVVCQERIHIILVEEASTLGLRQDEIAQEEEADPAVEGEPVEYVLADELPRENTVTPYHPMINTVHDSTSRITDRTTQYISHGASWEGSAERRALYDAKMGRRMVITELQADC